MARFLPKAVDSILQQTGVDLELIVLDGGSTDGTQEILQRYGQRLRWHSGRDGGAAAALQRGFAEARGEFLGWLNADDLLEPGALQQACERLMETPESSAVYGRGWWIDEQGSILREYPVQDPTPEQFAKECPICQPACFFRASTHRACGGIDPQWKSAFDYDLWIRLAQHGPMLRDHRVWARSRMHRMNKTLGERNSAFEEGMAVLERHFHYVPFSWIYSQQVWRRDGRDQFFEPLRPSIPAYLATLPLGLTRNPRHPLRFFREWLGAVDWKGRLSGSSGNASH